MIGPGVDEAASLYLLHAPSLADCVASVLFMFVLFLHQVFTYCNVVL